MKKGPPGIEGACRKLISSEACSLVPGFPWKEAWMEAGEQSGFGNVTTGGDCGRDLGRGRKIWWLLQPHIHDWSGGTRYSPLPLCVGESLAHPRYGSLLGLDPGGCSSAALGEREASLAGSCSRLLDSAACDCTHR